MPRRTRSPTTSTSADLRLLVLLPALLLAVSCGRSAGGAADGGPTTSVGSGLQGLVTVDGGCPPSRDQTACPDRPLAATVTVTPVPATGESVRLTTGSGDGRFSVAVPPGRYEVAAANTTGAPVPLAPTQTVEVVAGQYTQVHVVFDSGVR